MCSMRSVIVALAVLAGCYDPTLPAGVPCRQAGEPCPGNQACVAGVCGGTASPEPIDAAIQELDAFVPDGSPADLDADGIPNTQDN